MSFKRLESGLLVPEFSIQPFGVNLRRAVDAASMGTLVGAKPPSASYIDKVLSYSPIGYWPLNESSGTNADNAEGTAARDGTYVNTPSLGQTGIGDGETSVLLDPAQDEYVELDTASFNAVFDGNVGSFIIWVKMSGSGVWTDSTIRVYLTLNEDGFANQFTFQKSNTSNRLDWKREGNNEGFETILKTSVSETGWMCLGMTWDSGVADAMKAYYNGSQEGSTVTSLATHAGAANWMCRIGNEGGAGDWDGYAAHCAVFDSVLSSGDMSDLATV